MRDERPAGADSGLTVALAPVALALSDPRGQITAANESWEALTGWSAAVVVTKRLQDLVTGGARLFLETHCLPVAAAGNPVDEAAIEVVAPDGSRVPMLLYARRDPSTPDLHLALAPARQRHAQQAELRRMRDRERRNNDLQMLVARLSERALAGLEPAQLSALAASGLHDLLPADLATVTELAPTGAVLIASCGSEPGGDDEADVAVLRVPVGSPERPDAVLAVHRRGAAQYTSFENGAVEAVAQTLSTAFGRFHEVQAARHRAAHDQLTGLANRHQLLQRLDDALREAQAGGLRPALLYLDLDGFKQVNDTFGHDAGDRLLQAVAERLGDVVRDHDVVARLGGDEFVVLCADVVTVEAAEQVARRIDHAFIAPFTIAGSARTVRASVGVALPDRDSSSAQALAVADAAMYRTKALRRDARG